MTETQEPTAREDGGNPRIDFYIDSRGKHRWRLWRSSDKVGQSSQGYRERGDRDDNLCEVLGGQLIFTEPGGLHLERHRIVDGGQVYERIPVRETREGV